MPAQPSWILRLPFIISQLAACDAPVVNRTIFESLFGVKRRRAIDLMQYFGGYRCGNTALLDRPALISALQQIVNGADYKRERKRKQVLSDKLDELHRYRAASRVVLPVSADAHNRTSDDLPAGITLSAGKLVIDFSEPEELFGKLYELAQAAVNDFDVIAAAVSLPQGVGAQQRG